MQNLQLQVKSIVLDYGRVIAAGTPDDIQANQAVIKAYLGVVG